MDKKERLERWDKYRKDENYLHLKKHVYSGQAGICRRGTKIAVSLFCNKKTKNVINDQGLLEYQYTKTNRSGSHDKNEIDSVKECKKLDMPLFIVLSFKNQIKLGKVSSFCDNKKFFTIKFLNYG